MARKKNQGNSGIAGVYLRSFIERIESLEKEKAEIVALIGEVFAEAKSNGFCTKTMRSIIKLRKMEPHEREEYEALLDIYKGALGMLNGTPLGEAALRRLSGEKKEEDKHESPDDAAPSGETNAPQEENKEPEPPQPTIEEVREMARNAALEGRPVTENPFPARDPRRAAWDEEWCKSTGTDGMELPEAWRRSSKKKDDSREAE